MKQAQATRTGGRGPEAWSWVFMRLSGLALVFLALAHFAITHILNDVAETGYSFVAGRWQRPFWQVFDWLLLVLALVHGANGVRGVIDDYVRRPRLRATVQRALYTFSAAVGVWGTFTILTFR